MKTRTIKELLEVMLDHEVKPMISLCVWVKILAVIGYLNDLEEKCLLDYIEDNPPNHDLRFGRFKNYYWPIGHKDVRISWIKEHIAKLEKNESKLS